jgi:hypothetical protein
VGLLAAAVPRAHAQVVDFDVSVNFNTDTVVNTDPDPPTPFDEDNDPVGNPATNFAFLTQSAALAAACPTPAGLPDNGVFAANADHPAVHLAYNNALSFLNTRRSNGPETYSVVTPVNNYTNVHAFFASGDGNTSVTVTLHYLSGQPQTTSITVPSWLAAPAPPAYALFDGGDRMPPDAPFVCDDANTVALFGFNITADPARLLSSVDIARTDNTTAVLNFYGATGVLFVPVELQSFTVE